MLKRPITYTDFDGVEQTKVFMFNLTEAELAELNIATPNGLELMIQEIVEKKDGEAMTKFFRNIILKSFGEKSTDGQRFIKTAQMAEEFSQTAAYSALYIELLSDPTVFETFFKGIIPAKKN